MTQLPNVLHPTTFVIGEIRIQVMAYFELTDAQAAAIARFTYRSRKWTKKDARKVHIQMWTGDRAALAMLAPSRPRTW